jgi:hypothetical protein
VDNQPNYMSQKEAAHITVEKVTEFLSKLEEAFPTDHHQFRGNHHIYRTRDKLCIGVWYRNSDNAFGCDVFELEETDDFNDDLLQQIKEALSK